MSQKQSQKPPRRSLLVTIVAVIIVAISAIFGVDILEIFDELSGTPVPTQTAAPSATPEPTETPDFFATTVAIAPESQVEYFQLGQGFGAQRDFWAVYFTSPTGSTDPSTYTSGVDDRVIEAINGVQRTLDIAAFEWNNPRLTQAVVDAQARGVQIRMVVDDEHAMHDEGNTLQPIMALGVPVVDDQRSGLMHNKFMIMDGISVWTGSMNYTINGTYRNNNNVLVLRSQRAVEAYQNKFNEMFEEATFGSSRSENYSVTFSQDGVPVKIIFAPEDDVVPSLLDAINRAETSIHFMTFSFTLDEVVDAILAKVDEGVVVEGVFEARASRTEFSALPPLFCAGLDIRQDGNPFTYHHKVFIIDEMVVTTGSFNISSNATTRNDENMVIIQDPDLAAMYMTEFRRTQAEAVPPPADAIDCG